MSDKMREAAFLVALAEAGIPADLQEVLVHGNPSLGIPPGALSKALAAIPMTDAGEEEAGRAVPAGPAGFAPNPKAVSVLPDASPSRERGGEFAEKPTAALAAQCRMQARENLDPEYSRFMFAVADRLQGFAASKSQGHPSTDWQLTYAIEWANRSVDSVKEHMWAVEDALQAMVTMLANTGFHNSIEMAAARKLLHRDSDTRRQAETGTGSVRSTGSATPEGDRP